MAITPLTGIGTGAPVAPKPREQFSKVLKQETPAPSPRTELSPQLISAQSISTAAPGKTSVHTQPIRSVGAPEATKLLDRVTQAQHRMDEVLSLAQSGKSFSPAELLSLQTHVYRASQELDLAGKVVEKATGGVKQVLQTQV